MGRPRSEKEMRLARIMEALGRHLGPAVVTPVSAAAVVQRLLTIERSLQRIGERQCSEEMAEEMADKLERQEARLEAEASELARAVRCTFYRQSDPRGCQVYLIRPGDVPKGAKLESCYTNGIAVCL